MDRAGERRVGTVSVRITYGPWGETLAELCDAARRAEDAGAEVVWCPELHRSATVTAAALVQSTRNARVGTAIALAFTRTPMTLALEALDVDELAGGRFILGIGSGVRALNERWHNARFGRPAEHLRETVRNLREFWAKAGVGAPIDLDGEYEPMRLRGYRRPFPQVRTSIPIYLAGMGPLMTRLAGEIGDGWISHELCSPAYLKEHSVRWLAAGLDSAGRSWDSLDVVVSALCAVDSDASRARRWAAGTVGFYASVATYQEFFAYHGYGHEQEHVMREFRAGAGADELGPLVSDSMVDTLTLSGTADDVRTRLAAYEGLADTVKLTPPTHGVSAEESRACQDHIIDMMRHITGRAT
jgi:probable F420-dependent oxidoreductase